MANSGKNETSDPDFTLVGESKEPGEPAQAGQDPSAIAKVDFSTFVLSLSTSALYHLGHVPDPVTGEAGEKNIALVRQTIDVLELLQIKTAGNLEAEEDKLLNSLIYDLRMKVVEES